MSKTESEREEIANRIRTLRRSRSLTIDGLAKAVTMSPGYLSEVERGQSALSGEKLARIAEHLGVTVDYLLLGRIGKSEDVTIPPGLSEAAKALDLTYAQTLRLLAGKESLVARRAANTPTEWRKEDWLKFHERVKKYL